MEINILEYNIICVYVYKEIKLNNDISVEKSTVARIYKF